MAEKRGPWTVLGTECIYKDNFVTLNKDEVKKPNGEPGHFATVLLRKGVAILPIDEEENVFLTRHTGTALNRKV